MNKGKKTYLLALLPFFLLILLYELIPLAIILIRSFMPEGGAVGFTLTHYMSIFTKRLYQQAVLNSVAVSLFSAAAGLFIAFFAAKAACEASGRMRGFFVSVLNMTSNFAGIPLAFAYIILLGKVGVLVMIGKSLGVSALAEFDLYSLWGLMITYVYFQVPLATLLLIPSFSGLQRQWREAVSLLGGTSLRYWIKVGVPVLMPGILGTASVLFANSLAAYATAYALLQNNFSLLPIRIAEQFVGDVLQRKEFGSALAVVMMALMVAAISIQNWLLKRQIGGRGK